MYFLECEALANEYKELKELIIKIDEILYSNGPSSVFRPDEIASYLNEKLSKVTFIFNNLSKKRLLRVEIYMECPNCNDLIDPRDYKNAIKDEDPFECPQCQIDLIQEIPKEVKIYRVNLPILPAFNDKKDLNPDSSLPISKEFHQKLSQTFLENPFRNTPLLQYYSRDPQLFKVKPFKNKLIFFILHFLRDLIPFIEAIKNLGLDLKNTYFFYKDYPYPQREAIREWLEKEGARVNSRSYIRQYLEQITKSPPNKNRKILIMEDGGFIVPLIHNEFPELIQYTMGAVEQTTRGIRNVEKLEKLKIPIISVATSKLKSDFEPPYIAKAVIDNIKRLLPNVALDGKTIALFGYGTIGKEIAKWFRKNGAIVTIFETVPEKRLWAKQNGFIIANSPMEAVRNKNFVVGASGNASINSQVIASLSHDTYIISASSELYEIDIEELYRQQNKTQELKDESDKIIGTDFFLPSDNRVIHVLANGYPINFWNFESMPKEASDLVLSLILLSSAELALGNYSSPIINPDAVNQLAEKYEIAKKYLEFHK